MRYALLACLALPAFSAATRVLDRQYGPQFEDRFGACPLSIRKGSHPSRILGCDGTSQNVIKFVDYIAKKKFGGSIPRALDYLGTIGITLAALFLSKGAWQLHHATRPIGSARGFSTGQDQAPERLRYYAFWFEQLGGYCKDAATAAFVKAMPRAVYLLASTIVPLFMDILLDLDLLGLGDGLMPVTYVAGAAIAVAGVTIHEVVMLCIFLALNDPEKRERAETLSEEMGLGPLENPSCLFGAYICAAVLFLTKVPLVLVFGNRALYREHVLSYKALLHNDLDVTCRNATWGMDMWSEGGWDLHVLLMNNNTNRTFSPLLTVGKRSRLPLGDGSFLRVHDMKLSSGVIGLSCEQFSLLVQTPEWRLFVLLRLMYNNGGNWDPSFISGDLVPPTGARKCHFLTVRACLGFFGMEATPRSRLLWDLGADEDSDSDAEMEDAAPSSSPDEKTPKPEPTPDPEPTPTPNPPHPPTPTPKPDPDDRWLSLIMGMACALIFARRCLRGATRPADLPDGAYWFVVGGWEVIVIAPYQSVPGIRDAWEAELAGLRFDAAPLVSTEKAVRVDMADLALPAFERVAYYEGRVAEAEAVLPRGWPKAGW